MVSKQAEKSIRQYRRFAKILSALYRSPSEITNWRINLFRWLVDLQGTFGPKAKGTIKEEFNFNGINTWKISTPNSSPDRVLLYFHGGAYSLGSPKSHYSLVSYLADITKTTVYVPDYRLGPESKYPAQLEDAITVYNYLLSEKKYNSNQIAFGGDSAGGNLALVTLLKLIDTDQALPTSLALLSPWTDLTGKGESYTVDMANRDLLLGPIFKRVWENNDTLHGFYITEGEFDPENQYMVPLKGDFSKSPPIMIQVGSEELLLSDSESLKKILDRDNCENEYFEWEGMYHVFHIDIRMPETISAFEQIGIFLNKHLPSQTENESEININ